MFLHRRWLQKLSIKVQVLNANMVAICMPYGEASHEVSHAECKRLGSARCCGAAVADGNPPTASSSERAGGDRHLNSIGRYTGFVVD
jgi:hypothetical protein